MSFDSSKRKDNSRKIPLIEENANSQFSQLQSRYIEFMKDYEEISNYEMKLNKMTRNEYEQIKNDIHYKIHNIPEIIKAVDNLVESLLEADFKDSNLKSKVNEQVKIINERLKPKQRDLSGLLNTIVEKETKLARKISRSGIEDIIMNYESSSRIDTDSNLETEGNKKARGSFRESKLVVQELVDNSEYLRKRQEELEQIKKISSQVKDITNFMASEVTNQAVGLKSIEDSVAQTNINVRKAEFEIEQAEKITRGGGKKLCCLISIILFLAASLIAIILILFLGKSE